jgi:hypothetical protein
VDLAPISNALGAGGRGAAMRRACRRSPRLVLRAVNNGRLPASTTTDYRPRWPSPWNPPLNSTLSSSWNTLWNTLWNTSSIGPSNSLPTSIQCRVTTQDHADHPNHPAPRGSERTAAIAGCLLVGRAVFEQSGNDAMTVGLPEMPNHCSTCLVGGLP